MTNGRFRAGRGAALAGPTASMGGARSMSAVQGDSDDDIIVHDSDGEGPSVARGPAADSPAPAAG